MALRLLGTQERFNEYQQWGAETISQ